MMSDSDEISRVERRIRGHREIPITAEFRQRVLLAVNHELLANPGCRKMGVLEFISLMAAIAILAVNLSVLSFPQLTGVQHASHTPQVPAAHIDLADLGSDIPEVEIRRIALLLRSDLTPLPQPKWSESDRIKH